MCDTAVERFSCAWQGQRQTLRSSPARFNAKARIMMVQVFESSGAQQPVLILPMTNGPLGGVKGSEANQTHCAAPQVFEGSGAPPVFLAQAAAAIFERSCGLPLFISQMAVHLRQVRIWFEQDLLGFAVEGSD